MTIRKSGYGFGLRRRAMAVEPLEGRAMLAGNVSVSVSGGSLFVTGDNSDNLVLIQQVGDGEYAVSGFDFADGDVPGFKAGPTKINGDPNGTVVVSGVTGDINVNLKKGNDGLGMGNSVEDLASLAEDCGFGFGFGDGSGTGSPDGSFPGAVSVQQQVEDRFFVPRNLIVNTSDGNDAVIVNADVEGQAIINAGSGRNAVAFGNTLDNEDDVNVGGSLIISSTGGADNVCVQAVTINDVLSVSTGNGSDLVHLSNFDAGQVSVVTGSGNDYVTLNSFDTDRTVVVNVLGGNDSVYLSDFSAGQGYGPREQSGAGYVTVITGSGNDEAHLTEFEADGVYLDTGSGNDGTPSDGSPITVADADITNFLTVVTGGGNDQVNVVNVHTKNMVIDTGSGNDGTVSFPVLVHDVVVDNLTIVTGTGNDNVYVEDDSYEPESRAATQDGEETAPNTINNNLVVNMGTGNDILEIVGQTVGRDVTVILGTGNDSAAIGVGDEYGAGGSERAMTVGHNLFLDAGTGNDKVGIGFIEVHNDLFAFLGTGNDILYAFDAEVDGNALIDAGSGNDQVYLNDIFVKGNATIFMGTGNDRLSIFSSNGNGSLKAYGGPGKDTFANDLGIDSNGTFDDDVEIREFEFFEEAD